MTGSVEADRRVLLAERDRIRADRQLREASAKHDALAQQLAGREAAVAEQQRRILALEQELARMYASSSWRWSAPVRAASLLAQRVRAVFGGPPPSEPISAASAPALPPPPALGGREQAILARLQQRR